MTRFLKYASVVAICVATSSFVGCGPEGPKTYPVAGTVTVDGKPLPEGLISFRTIENGAIETMNIKEGQFRGTARDGERRVEIYFLRKKTQEFAGVSTPLQENMIPARYNTESTLTAKVNADGPNEFTFALEPK